MTDYQQVAVKPGSSVELPCLVHSNLAQVMWKSNGSALTEASRFHHMGESGLLIYSVAAEDQGQYECWSVEWAPAVGKNFSRLLAGYVLTLELPPRVPEQVGQDLITSTSTSTTALGHQDTSGPHAAEGNDNTDRTPLTTTPAPPTSVSVLLTSPHQTDPSLTSPPSSTVRLLPKQAFPDCRHPAAECLQQNNSMALLMLFLLFFLLFLAALVYNCYMQYLPAPCLRLRAALLGSHKSAEEPEYLACEAGLMEAKAGDNINMTEHPAHNGNRPSQNLRALRDTGYETEPECGNGRIPSASFDDSSTVERPFDVDCDSQSIQFADADEPYC